MGIPHTLPGIIGFAIFAGFLISISLNETDNTKNLQNDMMNSINQSTAQDTSLFGAFNLLPAAWSAVQLTFIYMANFLGFSTKLPTQFEIFFILLGVLFVVAIIKLLRGVWDF